MAQAVTAIQSARAYLNDVNGISWTDSILMPLLQEAHGELVQELLRNNIPVIRNQTSTFTVYAGALDLGVNQPSNIVEPVSIMEKAVGDSPDFFVDMVRVSYLPQRSQQMHLLEWAWINEQIKFVGATQDRSVLLRYRGTIATPTLLTDPLGVILAERFLGPRIASLALLSIGDKDRGTGAIAEVNLNKIIQTCVNADQRPVRRRGYRSMQLHTPYGSTPVISTGSSGGTSTVNWLVSTTVPNGVITDFVFSQSPKWVSWNGVNQFQGVGYTLTHVGADYIVTFIDALGNTLTPNVGDDIREAV